MLGKKTPMLSAIFSTILGGETIESIFARQVADENGWYYVGYENDCYKFHDVINDKEILMTSEEIMKSAIKGE